MEKFYLTYPQRIAYKKNCYSIIEAETLGDACEIVVQAIGSDWSNIYTAEQFLGKPEAIVKYPSQIETYHLTEIPLK